MASHPPRSAKPAPRALLRAGWRAAALACASGAAALAPTCSSDGARPARSPAAHPPVFNPLPGRPVACSLRVQMAYNRTDRLVFARLSWESDRGHLDAFWHYRDGQWVPEGRPLRAVEDPAQVASAEARLALFWSDPAAPSSTPNFNYLGCALACHDDGTYQPDWTEDGRSDRVTMHLPPAAFYSGTALDAWTWRAHTSGANGYWSDEFLDDTQPPAGPALQPDPGGAGAAANELTSGHPRFVYDPATTSSGWFAVPVAELAASPDYFFEDPANPSAVAGIESPKALDWDAAALMGYAPFEGDTVPYWVLARPTGSRGDILSVISADGGATVAEMSSYDPVARRWTVYLTRAVSGGSDDLRFQVNRQYTVAFAVHRDLTAGRDHYVSLPVVAWIEDPGNPGGAFGSDFTVRQLTGSGVLPDFSDTGTFPVFTADLFLPGVLSFEYLTDTREAAYLFGQTHGGAADLAPAVEGPVSIGCRACHTVRVDDPLTPFLQGGALELRAPRRGGLFSATPISLRFNAIPALEARCLPCHAPGGSAASLPFAGVPADRIHRVLTSGGLVAWRQPAHSPLLRVPAEDRDGNHPPAPPLAGFDGSPDYLRILHWIRFNAPNN